MGRESIYTIPYSKIPDGSKVVLYGFGKMGKNVYQHLSKSGRLKVVAILDTKADNFLNIWETVQIFKPWKISELKYDYILITVENRNIVDDLERALCQYGVEKQRIFWVGSSSDIDLEAANEVHKFTMRALSAEKTNFFLFMLPEHGNTGDYAIGCAEQKFFKQYFSSYQVYGVTTSEWMNAKDFFKNLIREKDVIFMNGGGYLGNLRGDDIVYKDIIQSFPNNKIIFLPNNLTYEDDPSLENKAFLKDIEWFKSRKEVYILLRERRSFELLSQHITHCYLFPDMAFLLTFPRAALEGNGKVLLCMRDDCEKIFKKNKQMEELLLREGILCDKFDINTKTYFSQEMGMELLMYVIHKFQEYDCVITDRLHGMILSVISDVPCVAIDNSTHKVSGVYEWIKNKDFVYLMQEGEIENIAGIIKETCINKKKAGSYQVSKEWFKLLAERLYEILGL